MRGGPVRSPGAGTAGGGARGLRGRAPGRGNATGGPDLARRPARRRAAVLRGAGARAGTASHVVDHNMETAPKPLSHNAPRL